MAVAASQLGAYGAQKMRSWAASGAHWAWAANAAPVERTCYPTVPLTRRHRSMEEPAQVTHQDPNRLARVRLTRRTFLRTLATAGMVSCGAGLAACGSTTDLIIEMTDEMRFVPSSLTVKVGDTVTWRNTDRFDHSATGDAMKVVDPAHVTLPDGAAPWDSGLLASGQSWSHTFDVPGEYRYCCLPHELGGMIATITVEES